MSVMKILNGIFSEISYPTFIILYNIILMDNIAKYYMTEVPRTFYLK